MSINPFSAVLQAAQEPGSPTAAWQAAARLYHAYYTGLILTVATRGGARLVGDWVFHTFRRQHEEKFLSSFDKLGLSDLPHAVAAAQYHYLSNSVGGVEVEYMYEADDKAWVHFCHPRWIYDGTALCAVPIEVSHGFLRGWYAQNGVSLGNPRLGFVCTSQDMTGQYGFAGYFREFDRELASEERLQFAPDEMAPKFDPAAAPRLDPQAWPAARLHKANRNYSMEYVKTSLPQLVALAGPAEAAGYGNLAAQQIGRQYYRQVQALLGLDPADDSPAAFARFMAAMATAQDDHVDIDEGGEGALVRIAGWRLMRAPKPPHPAVFQAWNGLWEGCLAVHNRFLVLEVLERLDYGDPAFIWRIRAKG